MIRVFIGFDPRQPIAFQVAAFSVFRRCTKPVSITPLVLSQLPIDRRGLTEFTFSRYLPPYLCEYRERSIFMDADVLCLGDVSELMSAADPKAEVSVVKGSHRFEWPSVMVFNNHLCRKLTPEYVNNKTTQPNKFDWANSVGSLPKAWNHLVGYDGPDEKAKLVHYTAGIPCWPETKDCEFSALWHKEAFAMTASVSFEELMGRSVHAKMVKEGGLRVA